MRRTDRFLLWELTWPTALAPAVALFLLLSNRLVKLLPIIIAARVPFADFLAVLGYLIPPYLVTALPVAYYMAVIVVLHRLVQTGEWGAVLSSGASPATTVRVIPVLGLLIAVGAGWTIWTINPAGRVAFFRASTQLVAAGAHRALATGVVHELGHGVSAYIEGINNDTWVNPVFLFRDRGGGTSPARLLSAHSAAIEIPDDYSSWKFTLNDGWSAGEPGEPLIWFDVLQMELDPPIRQRLNLNAKERTFAQLREVGYSSETTFSRECRAEIHGRIGAAILIFLLPLAAVALGLGNGRRRGGKGGGLLSGLLFFGLYYLVTSVGRKAGVAWSGPVWMPMYAATLGFGAICVTLYMRAVRRGIR